jgi:hypothetical protein
MATDIQFPATLPGTNTFDARLVDNNGDPSTVLEAAKDFSIDVEVSISPETALVLGGDWDFKAYAEAIGPGPECQLGTALTLPINGTLTYKGTIVVPAGTLPDLDPQPPVAPTSGAYKIVVLLGHRNYGRYTDISAIVEFPVVRIG